MEEMITAELKLYLENIAKLHENNDEDVMTAAEIVRNSVAQENFNKAEGMIDVLNEIYGTHFGWRVKELSYSVIQRQKPLKNMHTAKTHISTSKTYRATRKGSPVHLCQKFIERNKMNHVLLC